MPSPPSDSVVHELQALRSSLDTLSQRVGELAADNGQLREQLTHSQTARKDLTAQAEHLISMLDDARRELRELRSDSDGSTASG